MGFLLLWDLSGLMADLGIFSPYALSWGLLSVFPLHRKPLVPGRRSLSLPLILRLCSASLRLSLQGVCLSELMNWGPCRHRAQEVQFASCALPCSRVFMAGWLAYCNTSGGFSCMCVRMCVRVRACQWGIEIAKNNWVWGCRTNSHQRMVEYKVFILSIYPTLRKKTKHQVTTSLSKVLDYSGSIGIHKTQPIVFCFLLCFLLDRPRWL